MIYFTSDLHLFYRRGGPIVVGARRFPDAEAKDRFLIERWNEVVTPEDLVYILGDLSEGDGGSTGAVLSRLHGVKYLVTGNNDRYLDDPGFDPALFQWVKPYYELHAGGQKYVLFHYPIEAWSGYGKDRVHLHGHLHRRRPVYEPIRRYEVGVDAHDGFPVSLAEIDRTLAPFHNFSRRMPGLDEELRPCTTATSKTATSPTARESG